MPNYDRTGPRGFGPMSGWGLGPCGGGRTLRGRAAGYGPVGWRQRGGRGFGPGWGRGGWWVGDVYDTPSGDLAPEDERSLLKGQRNRLKAQLRETEERLKDLASSRDDDPGA